MDVIKSSEIKVYLSSSSTIESVVSRSAKIATNNALKLLNDIKLRQTALNKLIALIKDCGQLLEFLEVITANATVKVSRKRVKNLLKSLDNAINDLNNYNELKFQTIQYSSIKVSKSESFLLKMTYEIINCVANGSPFQLIVDTESAIFGSFILDLLEKSGFELEIDLIVVDSEDMIKLNTTSKPNSSPIVLVFESADIDSAVHILITSYINDTFGSINVFVQQSVHKRFCEKLRTRLINAITIGDRFDVNKDVASKIEVNCDAIDFDNESTGIQVFKFRTNEEIKSLIKHFVNIPLIRLWTEKTSLALEFAKSMESSSLFFINGSVGFISLTPSLLTLVSDKTELNLFYSDKRLAFQSILSANKK